MKMHAQKLTQVHYEFGDAEEDLFSDSRVENPWKRFFTPDDSRTALLRTSCLVQEVAPHRYAFIHDSLLEYFLTCELYDRLTLKRLLNKSDNNASLVTSPEELLSEESKVSAQDYFNEQLLVAESNVIQFLADRVSEESPFQDLMFNRVSTSKNNVSQSIAAANAITILNYARVSFSGMDLSGIHIPGADLSRAMLDHTNLSKADLSQVSLQEAWLRGSNFRESLLKDINVGERLSHFQESPIQHVAWCLRKHVVFTSDRHIVASWDLINRRGIGYTPVFAHNITALTTLNEEKWIAAGDNSGQVKIWQIDDRKPIAQWDFKSKITALAGYSKQGWLLIGTQQGIVTGWDVGTNTLLYNFKHKNPISAIATHSNGTQWVAANYGILNFYSNFYTTTPSDIEKLSLFEICFLAYSPDDQWLVTGNKNGNSWLWATSDLQDYSLQQSDLPIVHGKWHSDSRLLALGKQNGEIDLWEIPSRKHLHRFQAHVGNVLALTFSSAGLVSGGADHFIKLWDSQDYRLKTVWQGHGRPITHLTCYQTSVNDPEEILSTSEDGQLKRWLLQSAPTSFSQRNHKQSIQSLIWVEKKQQLISIDAKCGTKIWHALTGQLLFERATVVPSANITVQLSPDTSKVASIQDGICYISRLQESESRVLSLNISLNSAIVQITWLPDSTALACYLQTNEVVIWDIQKNCLQACLPGPEEMESLSRFCTSLKGKWLIGLTSSGQVLVWNREKGIYVGRLSGHHASIQAFCMSQDEVYLFTGSNDQTIRVWDIASKQCIQVLQHSAAVTSLILRKQGESLLAGYANGSIKLWLWQEGKCQKTWRDTFASITALAWKPHETGFVAGDATRHLRSYLLNKKDSELIVESVNIPTQIQLCGENLWVFSMEQVIQVWRYEPTLLEKVWTLVWSTQTILQPRGMAIAGVKGLTDEIQNVLTNLGAHRDLGWTPWHEAAATGNLTLLSELRVKMIEGMDVPGPGHKTPLHIATEHHQLQAIEWLLTHGANIEASTIAGWTPLLLATQQGDDQAVEILLQDGANKEVREQHGGTPLLIAAIEGYPKIVAMLLQAGANIEASVSIDKVSAIKQGGQTPLWMASAAGHTEIVAMLLQAGANKEIRSKEGVTPLLVAVEQGHQEVVKVLLEANVNSEVPAENNMTSLLMAAKQGQAELTQLLLQAGANKEARTVDDLTPLLMAAVEGHANVLAVLLQVGANKEAQNKEGFTPLALAASVGYHEVVRLLLQAGANKEARNRERWTPLLRAASNGHLDTVRILIQAGANKEAREQRQMTPILMAAVNGHAEVVEELIRAGANKEVREQYSATPLLMAAVKGHLKVVKLLLQCGVNIEAEDEDGITPLLNAAQCGSVEVVKALLQAGANKEARHQLGSTPLLVAAQEGHTAVVEVLIRAGADKEAKNYEGWSPLVVAAAKGHHEIVSLLLQVGVNKEATQKEGRTSLMVAAENGYLEIVNLLIEAGANPEVHLSNGLTPLLLAAARGKHEVVAALITAGADKEAKINGTTPLLIAAAEGHHKVVDILLQAGVNKEAYNLGGMTALWLAAAKGHDKVIKMLLEAGVNKEVIHEFGATPLFAAAQYGHAKIVTMLLEAEANKEAQDIDGLTPLLIALENGYLDIVEILVNAGANAEIRLPNGLTPLLNVVVNNDLKMAITLIPANNKGNAGLEARTSEGLTPLLIAAGRGYKEIVKVLLKAGANTEATQKHGATALLIAATTGQQEVVAALLEVGANKEAHTLEGVTPLFMAAGRGHLAVVQLLLENGANVHARDNHDYVIHQGVSSSNIKLVDLLLQKGANIHAEDNDGDTPLEWASEKNEQGLNIMQLLIERGADINHQNKEGNTALHLRIQSGHVETVVWLLQRGANWMLRNLQNKTALDLALENNQSEIIELIGMALSMNTHNEASAIKVPITPSILIAENKSSFLDKQLKLEQAIQLDLSNQELSELTATSIQTDILDNKQKEQMIHPSPPIIDLADESPKSANAYQDSSELKQEIKTILIPQAFFGKNNSVQSKIKSLSPREENFFAEMKMMTTQAHTFVMGCTEKQIHLQVSDAEILSQGELKKLLQELQSLISKYIDKWHYEKMIVSPDKLTIVTLTKKQTEYFRSLFETTGIESIDLPSLSTRTFNK